MRHICISKLGKAAQLPQGGGASSHPLEIRTEQEG